MSALPAENPAAVAAPRRFESSVWVIFDVDAFEGIDLNSDGIWLDIDGAFHPVADMLVTERLAAAAELEAMAVRAWGSADPLLRTRLYTVLLDLDAPARGEA